MIEVVRVMPWSRQDGGELDHIVTREWLVTNGLGGYASGTISGVITRRYHSSLVAALPDPIGRMVVLNSIIETVIFPDGAMVRLTGEERQECKLQMHGASCLKEFRLEMGLPVWVYRVGGVDLEKRLFLRYRQNTVQITYRILSGEPKIKLQLQPAVNFRPHNDVPVKLTQSYQLVISDDFYEISSEPKLPVLRMKAENTSLSFIIEKKLIKQFEYRVEHDRGYMFTEDLWSPGFFQIELGAGQEAVFVASTEPKEAIDALSSKEGAEAELTRRQLLLSLAPDRARSGVAAELMMAADQFIMTPAGREKSAVRIQASGDNVQSVIAGYHWFTDWGRDTMISLEGLTLLTGRHIEAGWILRTFAHYITDGLIPNNFPEASPEGMYNTADATLWFFHALDRYTLYSGDLGTLRLLLPKLENIIQHHLKGTRFGIKVDPRDGLLYQGEEGYALTWMDAKVGDWVVTPRRGKAVEINALWYNALKLLEYWSLQSGKKDEAQALAEHAQRAKDSFNTRFWYAKGGYLYDVVDGESGDDSSCRPNQILTFSLPYPVLNREYWEPVMNIVTERLLTPVGLRTLEQGHPDYKPKYYGDLRARDAAYHQGTVWPWLIGPFIDAWMRLYPDDKAGARKFLSGLEKVLGEACMGTLGEIFDAEEPFTPRGCVSQAWSVAEMLRAWMKTTSWVYFASRF